MEVTLTGKDQRSPIRTSAAKRLQQMWIVTRCIEYDCICHGTTSPSRSQGKEKAHVVLQLPLKLQVSGGATVVETEHGKASKWS